MTERERENKEICRKKEFRRREICVREKIVRNRGSWYKCANRAKLSLYFTIKLTKLLLKNLTNNCLKPSAATQNSYTNNKKDTDF